MSFFEKHVRNPNNWVSRTAGAHRELFSSGNMKGSQRVLFVRTKISQVSSLRRALPINKLSGSYFYLKNSTLRSQPRIISLFSIFVSNYLLTSAVVTLHLMFLYQLISYKIIYLLLVKFIVIWLKKQMKSVISKSPKANVYESGHIWKDISCRVCINEIVQCGGLANAHRLVPSNIEFYIFKRR